jgi:hypothetical protein
MINRKALARVLAKFQAPPKEEQCLELGANIDVNQHAICRLKRHHNGQHYDTEYRIKWADGVLERVSKALNWPIEDVRSMSTASLREVVRPVSPKLAHELSLILWRDQDISFSTKP